VLNKSVKQSIKPVASLRWQKNKTLNASVMIDTDSIITGMFKSSRFVEYDPLKLDLILEKSGISYAISQLLGSFF